MPRKISTREFIMRQLRYLTQNAKSEKQRVRCLEMLIEMDKNPELTKPSAPPVDTTKDDLARKVYEASLNIGRSDAISNGKSGGS